MGALSFYEEKLTLLLNIKKEDIDWKKYQSVSKGFEQKSEFHITLIGNYGGRKIKNAINTFNLYYQYNAVEKIRALAYGTNWSYSFLNLAHKMSKDYSVTDKRESIIQIVEVPGLVKFYNDLNEMLNIHLEYPLEHVTLFTRGTDPEKSKMGIGINSEIDFFALNYIPINI
jgi:hypothetical protein